jgi:hypothetical protein
MLLLAPARPVVHACYVYSSALHQNSNLKLRKPDHLDYHRDGITSAKTCVDAHPSKTAPAARMYRRRLWTKGSRSALQCALHTSMSVAVLVLGWTACSPVLYASGQGDLADNPPGVMSWQGVWKCGRGRGTDDKISRG